MTERHSLAGVARVNVTPSAGIRLEGYHRTEPSSSVLDRLYATILVLKAGDPIALLAIDHIGLPVAEPEPLRRRVGERLGVGEERVMACFSHTHSGPRTTPGYLRSLSERVERAAGEAAARLRPARAGCGVGFVEAGVNRRPRGPDGRTFMGEAPELPVDRRLGVLRVDGANGEPLAVLLRYGAHANVLKADSNVVSADWPGAARRVVEGALGCPALLMNGSAGDVNARWRGDTDALRRMGLAVGGEVLDAIAKIETSPLRRLETSTRTIPLRMQPLPDEATAERVAEEVAGRWGAPTDRWLAEVHRRRQRGETELALTLEIHAVRIEEGVLAGIPMEPFAAIGIEVARRFAGRPVFFGGYANGWIGYLPTAEEYPVGGYEVELAPVVHGHHSGWLTPALPQTANDVVTSAVESISEAYR